MLEDGCAMHGDATDRADIVARTGAHVRALLADDASGHDWWHVARVRAVALRIAAAEEADPFVVELAALLHDVADWKFHDGDEDIGPRTARVWLEGLGVEPTVVLHVAAIVRDLSFKGAAVPTPMHTREGAVVQDADRLDVLGAIGIARAFAFGGARGRPLHDPAVPPTPHATGEAYKAAGGPTINHFHEKLLLLKDRMNTDAGRRLAEERHHFVETFLERFLAEWDGRE